MSHRPVYYNFRQVFLGTDGMMVTTENFGLLIRSQVVDIGNDLLRDAYVERQRRAQEYLDIPVDVLLERHRADLAAEFDDEDRPLTPETINNRLNDFVQEDARLRRHYADLVATPYVEINLNEILTRYGPIPDVVFQENPEARSAYEVNPYGTMTQAAIEQLTYNYHRFGITLIVVPAN